MEIDRTEYINDLEIDKYNLDSAILAQPGLYAKYSNLWARAESERLQSKEALAVCDAELDKEARMQIANMGGKVTEANVQSYIVTHAEHKEAFCAYIAATEVANLLATAQKAFEHRRSGISDLVRLYTSNYFSEVPVGGVDGKTIITNIQEKKHAQLTQDLNDSPTKKRLLKR